MSLVRLLLTGFGLLTVAANAFAGPLSPSSHVAGTADLAINTDGHIAVLWVDRAPELNRDPSNPGNKHQFSLTDLYVAISRNGGETFDAPVKVNHNPFVVRGPSINKPRIAAGTDGSWHISYAANEVHSALDLPYMASHYTRSIDGGRTFEAPRRLSAMPEVDRTNATHGDFMSTAGFQTIAATADDQVHAFWIDTRFRTAHNDAGALYTAVSLDGGNTFSGDKQLLATDVCPCCQLMTATDANGDILLGLRDISAEGFRQPVVARLDTRAGSFSDPVDAGYAQWEIAGCPLKPTVVAEKDGQIYTAVYSGGEDNPGVYFSYSADGGKAFAPSVAVHSEALTSDAPAIAVNDSHVVVAWHGKTNGPRQIFYRMYTHDGAMAGEVSAVTVGPDNASNPVAHVRSDGRFQLVWTQSDRIHSAILPATPGPIEIGLR